MCSSHTKYLWLGLLVFAASCGEAPEYRFGQNISGVEFVFFDESEGVFPSRVTLQNPNNPFRGFKVSDDVKFDILGNGGNAGAFYAWATILASIPIGENQYFTAVKLRDIYLSNELAEEDQEKVRQMAVNGFQAVLDCFPDSVLFDATGTFAVARLATLSYLEILDLNGVPEGDWLLVEDSRGIPTAVRSTGSDSLGVVGACF
jgi:hypothetical protein